MAGDGERNSKALAGSAEFGLFEAVSGGQVFCLSLDERDRHRLSPERDSHTQDVVNAAFRAPPRAALTNLNGASCLLAAEGLLSTLAGGLLGR